MKVLSFPSSIPTPGQLELPRAQLTGLLHDLTAQVQSSQLALLTSRDAGEFAAAVHNAAQQIEAASRGWSQLSATVRDSWRIPPSAR